MKYQDYILIVLLLFLLGGCNGKAEREERLREKEHQDHLERMEKIRATAQLEQIQLREDAANERQSRAHAHDSQVKEQDRISREIIKKQQLNFLKEYSSLTAAFITIILFVYSVFKWFKIKTRGEVERCEIQCKKDIETMRLESENLITNKKVLIELIKCGKLTDDERNQIIRCITEPVNTKMLNHSNEALENF